MDYKSRLLEIVNRFEEQRIIIAGDLILDKSLFGKPEKISIEAPVQVIKVQRIEYYPGGSGNVFANISSLGGHSYLCGTIGNGKIGERLKKELSKKNKDALDGVISTNRQTTLKTRIYGESMHYSQQMLRIDHENTSEVKEKIIKKILEKLHKHQKINPAKILIFSDYAKGFLNPDSVRLFIEFCKEYRIKTIVDPKPSVKEPEKIKKYVGCFGFKPNEDEAQIISGLYLNEKNTLRDIADRCMEILRPEGFLLITRSEKGMKLYTPNGKELEIPPIKVEVADVTGAGDTTISALSLALSSGATLEEASEIANYAASEKVKKRGTATVSEKELTDLIEKL